MSIARRSRIYHKLQIAAHRLQKTTDALVSEASGLTSAQSAVLSIIAAVPEINQREVAAQLSLNESAVTAMVSKLIQDELITRKKSTTDRRVWVLGLTVKGQEKLSAVTAPFAEINSRIESELSEDEIRQLALLLSRLGDQFADG